MIEYSSLLVWGIMRKLVNGMSVEKAAETYGIPKVVLRVWRQRAAAGDSKAKA
jgi:transposase-like protein